MAGAGNWIYLLQISETKIGFHFLSLAKNKKRFAGFTPPPKFEVESLSLANRYRTFVPGGDQTIQMCGAQAFHFSDDEFVCYEQWIFAVR